MSFGPTLVAVPKLAAAVCHEFAECIPPCGKKMDSLKSFRTEGAVSVLFQSLALLWRLQSMAAFPVSHDELLHLGLSCVA